MGFKINPYDPDVANKMINSKQCRRFWYMDDLKILYVEKKVVLNLLKHIEVQFKGKFMVTACLEHVYLGMKIKFNIHDLYEGLHRGVNLHNRD